MLEDMGLGRVGLDGEDTGCKFRREAGGSGQVLYKIQIFSSNQRSSG